MRWSTGVTSHFCRRGASPRADWLQTASIGRRIEQALSVPWVGPTDEAVSTWETRPERGVIPSLLFCILLGNGAVRCSTDGPFFRRLWREPRGGPLFCPLFTGPSLQCSAKVRVLLFRSHACVSLPVFRIQRRFLANPILAPPRVRRSMRLAPLFREPRWKAG